MQFNNVYQYTVYIIFLLECKAFQAAVL